MSNAGDATDDDLITDEEAVQILGVEPGHDGGCRVIGDDLGEPLGGEHDPQPRQPPGYQG